MTEATVYNQEGKEKGTVKLPESVFGLPWNADLVHQVVVSMEANRRQPVAHTKDRGEVRGGGKKPWRQKGTGRARHGSSRSPLWVGGGVTHGPRNDKVYARKINRKMKIKALQVVLSRKLKDKEIIFVDSLKLPQAKTKDAKHVLTSIGAVSGFEKLMTKKKNVLLIALPKKEESLSRSFRNLSMLALSEVRSISPFDLLQHTYIMIVNPEESLKQLESRLT